MTLRRYSELAKSQGTTWPADVRRAIEARDPVCVGRVVIFGPPECFGALEIDHVRASGGIGMKSRSTTDNGVRLCSNHHRFKTDHGRTIRPLLLDYIATRENPHSQHVDPCSPTCREGLTDLDGTYHPTAEDYAMGNTAAGHEHWDV